MDKTAGVYWCKSPRVSPCVIHDRTSQDKGLSSWHVTEGDQEERLIRVLGDQTKSVSSVHSLGVCNVTGTSDRQFTSFNVPY